jgi:hypothetical protein
VKLQKSPGGKVLIILYYIIFGAVTFALTLLIMFKAGILAGLAAGLALGIVCGIMGGELEFIEHRKTRRKKHGINKRAKEPSRIIAFPENKKI